jgi:hypothetical protein
LQGKALAVLLGVLAAALLVACGQDSGSSTSGQPVSGSDAVKLRHFKQRIADLQEEREQEGKAPAQHANTAPEPAPLPVHHDSGGGAAQFRTKGGDNSIEESGVEGDAAERERAAAALHAYLDLRRAHRWAAACEYLAAPLIVTLERAIELSPRKAKPEGCPAVLAAMSKAVPQRVLAQLDRVDVASLRVNGRRGFLLYHGPQRKNYVMVVAKEAGNWRMAALDGSVLP